MSYWFIWPIGITIWLIAGWSAFAYFEAKALNHPANKDQITLSMFMFTIGSKFPLSILILGLLIGLFIGGLGVHFYWHWCPSGSISSGMLIVPFNFN